MSSKLEDQKWKWWKDKFFLFSLHTCYRCRWVWKVRIRPGPRFVLLLGNVSHLARKWVKFWVHSFCWNEPFFPWNGEGCMKCLLCPIDAAFRGRMEWVGWSGGWTGRDKMAAAIRAIHGLVKLELGERCWSSTKAGWIVLSGCAQTAWCCLSVYPLLRDWLIHMWQLLFQILFCVQTSPESPVPFSWEPVARA